MEEAGNNIPVTAQEIYEALPHNLDFLRSFGLSPGEIYEQLIDDVDSYWCVVIWGVRMFSDEDDGFWNIVETGTRGKEL